MKKLSTFAVLFLAIVTFAQTYNISLNLKKGETYFTLTDIKMDMLQKVMGQDANQKEFEGKNEVKAKNAGIKKEVKEHIIASSPKKIIKPKSNISNKKEITSSLSDDEWESF
jgi:hypothetical protein